MATRPWTPADYASGTLANWHDPSQAANITAAAGTVSSDKDLSGNGYDETQTTASMQPTYPGTAINGLSTEAFGGSQVLQSNLTQNGTTVRTFAFVVQVTNFSTARTFSGGGAGGLQFRVDTNGSLTLNRQGNSLIGNGATGSGNVLIAGQPAVVVGSYNEGTGAWALRLNGKAVASGTIARAIDGTVSTIGASTAGGNLETLVGLMGERVTLNSVALGDVQYAEGYLGDKWGLRANYPADHPYKSSGPTVTTADPGTTYTGSIALGTSPAQVAAGLLAGASAASLGLAHGATTVGGAVYAAQVPLAASAALTGAPSVTASVAAAFAGVSGLSGAAAAAAASSLTLAALAAQTATSGLSASSALALAEAAGLSSASVITAAQAAALALALTQASGAGGAATVASLTIGASALAAMAAQGTLASAAPLSASLAQSGAASGRFAPAATLMQAGGTSAAVQAVASAAASLAEALGLGASTGGAQSFSAAVALAVTALQTANGRGVQASPLALTAQSGAQVAGALGANAAATIAASAGAAAAGALTIAAGTTFQAATHVQAYGGLVVTGTLTLPVAPAVTGRSTASAAPSFAFTARLDPAAAATISGNAAASLAAQAAMAALLQVGDPYANAPLLRGSRSLTLTLQGRRMGTRTLAGTMRLTIAPQSGTQH